MDKLVLSLLWNNITLMGHSKRAYWEVAVGIDVIKTVIGNNTIKT